MIIASRVLRLQNSPNSMSEVEVTLFQPERDGESWVCRYEIGWPAAPHASAAYGVDSMQAIILAMQKIGADLYFSEHHAAKRLSWGAPGAGYGFPLPPNARENLVGDDRRFF